MLFGYKIPSDTRLALKVIENVCVVSSQEKAITLVLSLCKRSTPVIVSFINAHAYNLCCTNSGFSKALLSSDVIFRDGIGMQILYNFIGKDPGADLNGTDYIPELIRYCKGKRLALLGTRAPYLHKAAERLASQGHNIVLCETGFHVPAYYVNLVQEIMPEVIILGMGMPKQESLSIMLRDHLAASCLIINGGAILDFWGNKIYRAPVWLRRLKMEWFFRLVQEPRRLFSRYIIGNYVFLKRTINLRKTFDANASSVEMNLKKRKQRHSFPEKISHQ